MEPALLEEEELPDVPIDELRLARLKKVAQFMDAIWEMDFFLSPSAVQEKRGERPYYPYQILTVDHRSGFIFGTDIASPETYLEEFPERFLALAERLKKLGYSEVHVKWGDGYYGLEAEAPFDAIIVTCAANHVPPPLLEQLKEGGKLIIPLGSTLYFQTLTLITKTKGKPKVKHISGVRFVPMTGEAQKKDRE